MRIVVGLVLLVAPLACAQDGPTLEQLARREALGDEVDVRWDPATGAPAAIRFDPPLVLPVNVDAGPHEAALQVLERMGGLFGATPLSFVPADVRGFGPLRIVELQQRLLDTPVHEGRLAVTFVRRDDEVACLSVQGRVFRDVPAWLPDADQGGLVAPGRVVARLDDGAWRVVRREVVTDASGEPVEVLRALERGGEVFSRRSLARHGAARGAVPGVAGATPLRDLFVSRGGERVVTDDAGAFDGDADASLPWGLSGPHERVVPRGGADYPAARDGVLSLDFAQDDARRAELSVFYHLVETRRFFATIPGVPRAAVDTPVAAQVGLGDLNAFASPTSLTLEGRTFRYAVAFGYRIGLDPAIVTHERGHVLLFALGFDAEPPRARRGAAPPESDAIHEGLADYLAAARLGTPHLGAESGGDFGRSIDDDKVYPQDLSGGAHEDGMILSGALWDARRAAGARAPSIDAAALAAVPGLTGSATMPGLAKDILARAAKELQPVLREHLAAHGLLPDPRDRPPLIQVRPAGREQDPAHLSVEAGRALEVTVRGQEAGERAGRVDVLVAGPRFLTTRPGASRDGVTTVQLRLAPGASEAGAFQVTITAQSRRSGKQAVRTLAVMVLPAGVVGRRPEPDGVRVLQASAGQVKRVPLSSVAPTLPAGLPARLTLSGWLSGGVAVVGSELVLAPRLDEVGTHEFAVHTEPDVEGRSMSAARTTRVVLIVGTPAAELDVHEEQPPEGLAVVPPGQRVTVHAGATSRLLLRPVGHPTDLSAARPRPTPPDDDQGERRRAPRGPTDPWRKPLRGAVVVVASGPAFVKVGPGRPRLSEGLFAPAGAEVADHTLTVSPPADAPAGVHEVVLALSHGGREVARRSVRIVVVPREWSAPGGVTPIAPSEGPGLIDALERSRR